MRVKTDVTWFLMGQASDKIILLIQEIIVDFVYSRQQLNENLFTKKRIMAHYRCK